MLVLVLGGSTATEGADRPPPAICLQPLGKYDKKLLAVAERGIEYLYAFPVTVLAPAALPADAWYAPRKRWRAEKLLDALDRDVVPGSGCAIVIGFTREDISTTKGDVEDWGVLGLANLDGTSAVVSTFRMSRGAKGKGKARQIARRTVNVVNHELGHVLGLPHHDVPGCIMNDAQGTVRTVDRETGLFCDASRRAIEAAHGVTLPAPAEFDWDAVY